MQQCAYLFLFLLFFFLVDLPLAHWLVWLAMWQRVQAGLNAVIQPAAEGRMTGPISATCCPRPLPPFHLLRVPKGAVLSKQDEVFRKCPHCELVGKLLICNETVEMALGKENRSKHGPQICGQFRRKSVQHSGVLELARLALGLFAFICVTLI